VTPRQRLTVRRVGGLVGVERRDAGAQVSDHRVGAGRLNPLVVVPAVVVAAVRAPVVADDVLHADQAAQRRARVLLGEDGEPREHRPQAVLLAHVVGARAEGLLAAEEGVVVGLAQQRRVHQLQTTTRRVTVMVMVTTAPWGKMHASKMPADKRRK